MLSAACALVVLGGGSDVQAAPQANTAILPALCGRLGVEPRGACFAIAGHFDVMFARSSARDVGWGPALEVGTVAFDDLRFRFGPQVQLPFDDLSVVLTPSGYLRIAHRGGSGVAARAFVGTRSYNYGGNYAAAFGVVGGVDWALAGHRERNVMVGLHIDGMWSAIPLIALVSWLRSP